MTLRHTVTITITGFIIATAAIFGRAPMLSREGKVT